MFFDKEKLILEIQKQPSIWHAFSAEYKNNDTKDRAWEEISRAMFPGCSDEVALSRVSHIKKKWNNIRDCYRKYLREQKDTTSGEPTRKKKKYIFADILEFLNPMFDSKNFSTEPYFEVKENDESSPISGDEEFSTITPPPARSPIMQRIRRNNQNSSSLTSRNENPSSFARSSRVKRKRRHEKKESLEREVLEILRLRRTAKNSEEDGDKSFLMSFLSEMKSLNDIQKLQFKRGMLDLILNTKYQTNDQTIPKNESFVNL